MKQEAPFSEKMLACSVPRKDILMKIAKWPPQNFEHLFSAWDKLEYGPQGFKLAFRPKKLKESQLGSF